MCRANGVQSSKGRNFQERVGGEKMRSQIFSYAIALPQGGGEQRRYLTNFATNSTCGVWRNWSTGVTVSSR
jgi:hypothetical protein